MDRRKRGRKGISAHQCWKAFQIVQAAYLETRERQPFGASTAYLDDGERSTRLTIGGIEFCIDIEKATETALQNDAVLLDAWERLALEEKVDSHIANDIEQRCGRMYVQRGLLPQTYFRRSKYLRQKAA